MEGRSKNLGPLSFPTHPVPEILHHLRRHMFPHALFLRDKFALISRSATVMFALCGNVVQEECAMWDMAGWQTVCGNIAAQGD